MNNTLFARISTAAAANDQDAIASLLKLSLRTDAWGEKARLALNRLGVEVQHDPA